MDPQQAARALLALLFSRQTEHLPPRPRAQATGQASASISHLPADRRPRLPGNPVQRPAQPSGRATQLPLNPEPNMHYGLPTTQTSLGPLAYEMVNGRPTRLISPPGSRLVPTQAPGTYSLEPATEPSPAERAVGRVLRRAR